MMTYNNAVNNDEGNVSQLYHIPIMTNEVIQYLNVEKGKIFVDCTLGGAGHGQAILNNLSDDGIFIGIDRDKDAIAHAHNHLRSKKHRIFLFHANYIELHDILQSLNIDQVDGILADLGVSLNQIKNSGRGFSFLSHDPLDMRMNQADQITAQDIVNSSDEQALSRLFFQYGEERYARVIATHIVKSRKKALIRTSHELSTIVLNAIPKKNQFRSKIHPATRVFMALRIAVNHELEQVEIFMKNSINNLKSGGRMCVISFHSLEDRIVKQSIRQMEKGCICPPDFPQCVCQRSAIVKSINRSGIKPEAEEIARNPMARSSRLRVIEKL